MDRVFVLLPACALTMAAAAQPSDATLHQLLVKMDGAGLAEREEAERAFASVPGVTLEHLERLARGGELSPEQEFRLRQAARRIFELKPMAGMGVQFQGFSDSGVVIGQTIEGFPAHDVLRPGDMVVGCNGRRMRTQDELRWTILSCDPDEVLSLEIERGGQPVEVEVRLGSFDDLPNAQLPTPLDLSNAFGLRWGRAVQSPLEKLVPIGAGVSVDDWARVEAGESAEGRPPQWPLTRDSAARMVAFGGRPRSALSIRQALADFSGPMDAGDPLRERVTTIADIVDQIRALSRQRIVVDQRAQTLERHADMVVDPARKQQLVDMRAATLQEIVNIDAQLSALREALRIIREDGR
jgi:hypothetical protein